MHSASTAGADLDHTFAWAGITGLADGGGNAIELSRLSVLSDSGFDYRNAYVAAVPEPANWALLGAGLGVVALLRGTRRSRDNRA